MNNEMILQTRDLTIGYTSKAAAVVVAKDLNLNLKKGKLTALIGANGIGKSTLLESIASQTASGMRLGKDVKIGYYRQDFSTLDFSQNVFEGLMSVMDKKIEEDMRSVAAGFLLGRDVIALDNSDLNGGGFLGSCNNLPHQFKGWENARRLELADGSEASLKAAAMALLRS